MLSSIYVGERKDRKVCNYISIIYLLNKIRNFILHRYEIKIYSYLIEFKKITFITLLILSKAHISSD